MLVQFINKTLFVFFFMSCLVVIRHTYYFIQAFASSTDEEPVKYKVSKMSLFFLCLSLGFILASIFTGIKI